MKSLGKSRILFSLLSLLVIASVLLAACRPAATPTPAGPTPTPFGPPLRVGIVQTQLFGLGEMDGDVRAAMQFAVDDITGGTGQILGRKVEFYWREEQGTSELALRRAREMVEELGAELLWGTLTSGSTLAISGYAKEKKVLFYEAANAPSLTAENWNRYSFRPFVDGTMYARAMSMYIAERYPEAKRFYLTAPDYEYGWSMIAVEEGLVKELIPGAEIVGKEATPWGEPDFRPWITKWMATNPDAMISGIWGDDLMSLIRQATPLGFFDKVVFAAEWASIAGNQKALGMDMPDGVITVQSHYFLAEDTPENRAFLDRMKEITGRFPPDPVAYEAYIGIKAWLEAIQRAGTTEVEAVINELRGATVTGVLGESVYVRPFDHQFLYPMYIGRFTADPRYPEFKVLTDTVWISAEDAARPEAEVREARRAAGVPEE